MVGLTIHVTWNFFRCGRKSAPLHMVRHTISVRIRTAHITGDFLHSRCISTPLCMNHRTVQITGSPFLPGHIAAILIMLMGAWLPLLRLLIAARFVMHRMMLAQARSFQRTRLHRINAGWNQHTYAEQCRQHSAAVSLTKSFPPVLPKKTRIPIAKHTCFLLLFPQNVPYTLCIFLHKKNTPIPIPRAFRRGSISYRFLSLQLRFYFATELLVWECLL